jgi:tetratricopeptide (TPR) repeat protein
MRVESVFLEAIRMLDLPRKGALGLDEARPRALRPSWDLQEVDVRFELTEDEAQFVRVALAGDKTVAQLLSAGAPAGVDPAAVLTALIASGAVESRELVAAEQHRKPEPRKGPPPLPAWANVDEAKAKGAAETAVRAKRSLAPPAESASPLEQLLRAEQVFERGREAYARGDLKAALAEFESALALNGGSLEYRLFARWTQQKSSGAKLTAEVRDELERMAREALRENSQIAVAHYVLSVIHEAWGRTEEARASLARARDLDRDLFGTAPSPATPATAAMPAPAPVQAQVQAPKPMPPATPAKKSGSMAVVVSLAVALLVVIGGVVFFRQQGQTGVTPAPSASAPPAPSATAPFDAGADAASPPRAPGAGSAKAPPADKAHGVVHLPKGSAVHRIFVDGKTYTASANDQLVVACGHHDIRIGSQGTTRPVDVPCGGEVDLH